jgi:hypothetical protein
VLRGLIGVVDMNYSEGITPLSTGVIPENVYSVCKV